MKPNKATKFSPGTQFRLDRKVIFVEYESMTGELVKCRFDLSQKTEMIYNDHRILSFDDLTYLYSSDEEILIKKVLYYEKECHMVVGDKLLIPTKIYFENAGYQQEYESTGSGFCDWKDKFQWNMEEERRDKVEQWLREPPTPIKFISDYLEDCEKGVPNTKLIDPNKYFDTDMVMTKEEMQYCLNDVTVTEKLFKEEKIMRFDSCKPTIKNVIFNDPATIVMWSDGTKTVVKCGENDVFDPEKGVAMCCMKKLIGTNKTGSNYLDKVQEYFDKYDEDYIEECKTVGEILKEIWDDAFGPTHLPVPDVNTDAMDIPPEETVEKEFEAVTSDDWTIVPADENTTAEENGE